MTTDTTTGTPADESTFPKAAREALATAREETRLARLQSARIAAATGAGLAAEDAARLHGETAEELIADAQEFAAYVAQRKTAARRGATGDEPGRSDDDELSEADALVAGLFGAPPSREPEAMATGEDFDGGARSTPPVKGTPEQEHAAFVADLAVGRRAR